MSTVYNLEPQPTAKVLLQTTAGDISLELFAQQTPLASRNFLQHCLDSYYDNTIFHRLVPGFIIQGGDPTGTGHGGESSFDGGAPFADEFHSRLKFNRRGLLGMANTGEKDDNGSQFFLTLGKTEELTGRNTMFGRVLGDTIYNLVKMSEAELTEEEDSERPMYPTRITGTEVLVNPFEDMVPRAKEEERKTEDKQRTKKPVKKKAGKALLSFGNDEGDDADVAPVAAAKYNPKLIDAEQPISNSIPTSKRPATDTPSSERPSKRRASPPAKPKPEASLPPVAQPKKLPQFAKPLPTTSKDPGSDFESASDSDSDSDGARPPRNTALLNETTAQIEALKSSLKRDVSHVTAEPARKQTALEAMIPEGSVRGRKKPKSKPGGSSTTTTALSKDEQRTLDSFNAFKKRLEDTAVPASTGSGKQKSARDIPAGNTDDEPTADAKRESPSTNANGDPRPAATDDGDDEAALCDLHFIANCQSCSKWDVAEGEGADSEDENGDLGWMGRQLTFAKDRLGKDLEWKRQNEQELVVIDPKEKAREIKEEKRRERRGKEEKRAKR